MHRLFVISLYFGWLSVPLYASVLPVSLSLLLLISAIVFGILYR